MCTSSYFQDPKMAYIAAVIARREAPRQSRQRSHAEIDSLLSLARNDVL